MKQIQHNTITHPGGPTCCENTGWENRHQDVHRDRWLGGFGSGFFDIVNHTDKPVPLREGLRVNHSTACPTRQAWALLKDCEPSGEPRGRDSWEQHGAGRASIGKELGIG